MNDEMLHDMHKRVIETQTMVFELVQQNSDKEKRLRSLEATRHRFYGVTGIGMLGAFFANLEQIFETLKRSFH